MNRKALIKAIALADKITVRGSAKQDARRLAFLWQDGNRARVVAFLTDYYDPDCQEDQHPQTVIVADVGPSSAIACAGFYPREALSALRALSTEDAEPDADKVAPLELGDVFYLVCALGPALDAWRSLRPADHTAAQLRTLLDTVKHAVSRDETRVHLSRVRIESRGGGVVRAIATDGYRLALSDASWPDAPFSGDISINAPTVSFLGSLLPRSRGACFGLALEAPSQRTIVRFISRKVADNVSRQVLQFKTTLEVKESRIEAPRHILYRLDGCDVLNRLDGALYPPYEQVIPRETSRTFSCDRAALIAEAKRLHVNKRTHGLAIAVNVGCASLSADSEDKEGKAGPTVRGAVAGEWSHSAGFAGAFSIGVDARFLVDALEAFDGPRVSVGFNGDLDPIRIADTFTTCVVMPMRK